MALYVDRRHAGRVLASALSKYSGRTDVIVLALPRGGVPVAYEVARQLAAPLDVFVVRKLGVPGHEELAMGALASGGLWVLNGDIVKSLDISRDEILRAAEKEHRELIRRERAYRGERPAIDALHRTVILVDDGLATGATMRAAIKALRRRDPDRVVAAVPVAAPEICAELSVEADEMICAATPRPFFAVGPWYEDFSQTSDEEVRELLERQPVNGERRTPAGSVLSAGQRANLNGESHESK